MKRRRSKSLGVLARRELIALLGGAAVPSFLWPLLARAQQAPKGALVIGNTDPEQFCGNSGRGCAISGISKGKTFDTSRSSLAL